MLEKFYKKKGGGLMTAHVDKGKQIRFVLPDPAPPKFGPDEMAKRYQPLMRSGRSGSDSRC